MNVVGWIGTEPSNCSSGIASGNHDSLIVGVAVVLFLTIIYAVGRYIFKHMPKNRSERAMYLARVVLIGIVAAFILEMLLVIPAWWLLSSC